MNRTILTLTVLALFWGCRESESVQTFVRPVRTYTVEPLGWITKNFAAVVSSAQQTTLAFKMSGEVVDIAVYEGEEVKKGEFVAAISPSSFIAKEAAAKAQYLTAKSDSERFKRLLQKDVVSRQQYEAAYATYISAKSAWENALSDLEDTKLYSPIDGVIENRYVDKFQRVDPTQPVVKIANPDSLEVDFFLSANNLKIVKNREVQYGVRFNTLADTLFSSELIRFVDVASDNQGFPATLGVENSKILAQKYNIRAGNSCEVVVKIENSATSSTFAIPLTALDSSKGVDGDFVWIFNPATSTVSAQKVETGELVGDDMVAISSGVKAGDIVVSAGVYQLGENQKVTQLK